MRTVPLLAAALLATLLPCSDAAAQTRPAPAGAAVRYIILSGELMGDVSTDALLRESRQGGRLVSAVLDVCHAVSATSRRKDRFVAELRPEGGKLVGTAQSQEERQPVAVSLTRKQEGQSFSFEGTIRRGAVVTTVSSTDNSDMSETEYREQYVTEEEIVATPADFTQVTPMTIAVRIKREAFADFVKGLRGQTLKVGYGSLTADCADLRAGHQVVRIEAEAERAPQFVERFRSAPGVLAAGWVAGSYGVERAVRFPAAAWRSGGRLDRDKLAAALADLIGGKLSATLATASWDPITGELTLKFKRPDEAAPGLDLTQTVEVTLALGPEKPSAAERMIVWVGENITETVDASAGPRLGLSGTEGGAGEDAADIDVEAILAALAKGLNGELWDSEKSTWK